MQERPVGSKGSCIFFTVYTHTLSQFPLPPPQVISSEFVSLDSGLKLVSHLYYVIQVTYAITFGGTKDQRTVCFKSVNIVCSEA